MANPTSNFGWQMPTPTDLVTDLPADFEVFGQAVDTSLADLKGGTTGQVLSKTSSTDMDFTWVDTDDTNAIQNAIVDAKGDLIAASAADTPARLAVGANGETLVADSSTSTGLRYQAPVNANPLLNSAWQVWQRGTSFSASNSAGTSYWADRWSMYFGTTTGYTLSRQSVNDSTNLPNIQYCARIARASGTTGSTGGTIGQSIEIVNSIPYAGKTVTLSFYARKGADYGNNTIVAELKSGTGSSDSNGIYNTYTGQATVITQSVTLTTTWQRFTYSAAVGATATQLALAFTSNHPSTSGADDYYEITGVQLEVGSVATPFKTYAGTIQGELAACQRYYYRQTIQATPSRFGSGMVASTTAASFIIYFPVQMRIAPTALEQSGTATDYSTLTSGNTVTACSAVPTVGSNSVNVAEVSFTVASGLIAGQAVLARPANTSAFLGWSAEL
jgi:hypothetical protein